MGKLSNLHSCIVLVYEDEDELLWSPDRLSENKVRSFLSDVLVRTTDERTVYDKPGTHVRDDEQVSFVLIHPSFADFIN